MSNTIQDLVIVVIGGAGLLGKVFCMDLVKRGAVVIVADNNIHKATEVAKEISFSGVGNAYPFALDITEKRTVISLIYNLKARHGRIDAVVNSAYPRGPNYGRLVEDVTYEDFCTNVNVHLGGYFLVSQQFGIFFKEQGYGNLINLASIYSYMPPRFEIYRDTKMTMPVEYAAIKAGILQLTRYFASYYKGTGIRFNCLSPGGILDGQEIAFRSKYDAHCNSKGMLEAKDVSGSLVYLLSDESKYLTGQSINIDDGYSISS
ncbi:MAG TPA: flagellin modification protein A [Polynucleobacter sp.]|nr:flagellin modification protein A [Polynucleobacter sp.]